MCDQEGERTGDIDTELKDESRTDDSGELSEGKTGVENLGNEMVREKEGVKEKGGMKEMESAETNGGIKVKEGEVNGGINGWKE
nr:hypothetical protein BaRGS_000476 [Batillaria attramentaria]